MKYSQIIGIVAAILLVAACFMPWTYYPDLQKTFNGFYSEQNVYGQPGRFIAILAVLAIALFAVPRIWAKRANWLVCSIILAFAVRTFILFSGCYLGICPEKMIGIWLVPAASLIMLLMSFLPDVKMKEPRN